MALRNGGSCTANWTVREAEQWNNLCCRFGTEFNVNLHVGGDGGVPTNAKSESVTLIAVIEETPAARGKAGIQTDAYTKMRNDTEAAGGDTQAYGIWESSATREVNEPHCNRLIASVPLIFCLLAEQPKD